MLGGQILKNLWGCFSVAAREGAPVQSFCGLLLRACAGDATQAAGAAAVRRGHEKIGGVKRPNDTLYHRSGYRAGNWRSGRRTVWLEPP